ncbi:hypothetical protein RJ639_012693 [Escallonia herrerae]|uniref:ABC-type xenobiotic transporter n=1 Tax=Escallonia herrerae TaxID=1293975 RepID=A0AA88VNL9_9ASTE|nr:hypothetical protein RJ639_012693 [Escallonia herrerae]
MSSASWLTSLECSTSLDSSSFLSLVAQWLSFILLSPCPQRLLFSSIDLLFVFSITVFAAQKLYFRFISEANSSSSVNKPLLGNDKSQLRVGLWFKLSLYLTAILAIIYTALCVLAFTRGIKSSWELIDVVFRVVQATTFTVMSVLVAHEKKVKAIVHPMSLRIFWVVNFVIAALCAASAITRLIIVGKDLDPTLRMDDIVSQVNLPVSAFLFIVAIKGPTGIRVLKEPELDSNTSMESNVSGYATASLFSRATWLWMNPVLSKGYKSPLKMEEVPSLPPDHQAETMAQLFEMNWPRPGENVNNAVRTTLIRCFWKEIAFTGFLAVVRLSVMYIGPVLIQSFVGFTSGKKNNPAEGYYLILTLLISKVIEVLSSHQFNFQSLKLGMLIRSSVISAMYKKGLRLSCSSRQAHGVGQIVSYMAVDVQQLSDMMLQLHFLWMMPLQLAIALALLYGYMGVSILAALVALIAVLIFTLMISRWNNIFQFNVMKNRDLRMKATNELLNNMRVIKFQAWEEHFSKKIQSFRDLEYGWLSKFTYLFCWNMIVLWSVPILMAALTFAVAILLRVPLDAGKVFTATTIFKILQEPIRTFPQALISISQATISLGRLDRYMTSQELESDSVERGEGFGGRIAVEVKDGNFSWDDDSGGTVLKDVNLEIKKGHLAAIVGTVGSGKSSLLASILGELHKVSGEVRVCGTTGYVAQTSWIQNATIQENILFGSPMNRARYEEAIRVCCLVKDLEIMDHGDQTEIGERGINLSGGQKQRIQLARAIYQDCDTYLLDDVFSAVDAHTGSEIFKECVRGALKDKTIVLVTHQVDFLHNADLILVMRDGKIVQSGRYEELLESGMDFGALVAAHETSMELVDMSTTTSGGNSQQTPRLPYANSSQGQPNGEGKSLGQSASVKGNAKLIEDEERATGRVNFDVYRQYCTEAYGWWGVAAVILVSVVWQFSLMGSDYWLAYETSKNHTFSPSLFINIYSIIASVSCTLLVFRSFLVTFLGLKTAQSFFNQILCSISHAPMSFFDTTPSGRLLTRVSVSHAYLIVRIDLLVEEKGTKLLYASTDKRFIFQASTDQASVDFLIPLFLAMTLTMYFTLLGILVITCQYAWPTIFLIIPLAWLNIWYRKGSLTSLANPSLCVQGYYLASSRELSRLDSITKAPAIHHFSETITGVMTIRCFGKHDRFVQGNIDRVNANLRMDFHNNGSNEWLGFRLELIGSFVLCVSTMFMVFLPSSIVRPENVGLSLSYGLPLNTVLFWAVYMSCFVENRMVAVERLKQFINIPSEAAWKITESLPSPNWPSHGNIEIEDLQVRYRPNTPLVLKGISLSIHGGEKIGVVGRTGGGKSTLIQVFFRLVEPSAGKIMIDGVDICKLGLHDLRSRFGIIPQDPVLFEGTVRSNIDPIGLYSDEEIWKSLDRCQLMDVVAAKPEKLDASVVDSGDNWSVGQRQLLCLGRVMLKRSRILFMDEATASVDSQTDAVIQKIIREDFLDCTIITIAHRIPTVIDCSRVLVIDAGLAKEFDTPSNLLERPSLFAALVQEYANRSSGF